MIKNIISIVKATRDEEKLIKILFANKKRGDSLTPRGEALKEVGVLKNKSSVISELYEKLIAHGIVEFNIRYTIK